MPKVRLYLIPNTFYSMFMWRNILLFVEADFPKRKGEVSIACLNKNLTKAVN